MWKNVNTWKIGLWCYHKYVKFISRFYFYSWKMASCRFVVWNWNLEVCFSSAVTLTTPPSSQVPPNLLLDFYRILEEKKKMEGGGKDAGILTSLPLPGGRQALRWGLLRISAWSLALRRPLENDLDTFQLKPQLLPHPSYSHLCRCW